MNDSVTKQVLLEVCVDSVASAVAAERGGADRVELCSDLLEGGITPSGGLIELVRSRISIPLHVIIRPRPGDFCYAEEEIEVMRRDTAIARRLRADGVVLGILDAEGCVDIERTGQFVTLARPLSLTFHRAFDLSVDLLRSLEDVCATGADRLLTSGGEQDCMHGVEMLGRLINAAHGRIVVMAGGGVRSGNAASIVQRTGVREIHAGLGSPVNKPTHGNPRVSLVKDQRLNDGRTQVLEESVRELKRALLGGEIGNT